MTTAGRPRLTAWGLPLGPLAANAYLVGDEVSGEAVVIDPGQEPGPLLERIEAERWQVMAILCTHAHFDHIAGASVVQARCGARVHVPSAERAWLAEPALNLSAALAPAGVAEVRLDDVDSMGIEAGFELALGGEPTLRALGTPGHTPGGLSFLVTDLGVAGAVFTGDTLFAGTIGRADLPGGDAALLLKSIRTALLTLPGATAVLPGHGRASRIEDERAMNPFLA